MMSELARGLFHRAIALSGTSFIETWPYGYRKENLHRFAKNLGWDGTGGERKILEILENTSAEKLVLTEGALLTEEEQFKEHILFPFTPVIEPYKSKNTFMAEDPLTLSENAWSNSIDCMIGYNSLEGGIMSFFSGYKHFWDFIPEVSDKETFDELLRKFYFANEPPSSALRHPYLLVRF
jgi:carboxylesterase type B